MKNFTILIGGIIVLLLTSCPGSEERDSQEGVIVVANKSGDDVHFIDRSSGELLLALPSGHEPHEVETSPDGRFAVVSNYGNRANPGNTLSVYDISEGQLVHTIGLGEHTFPHGMQWMPGGNMMLVTTEGSNHLLVVDVATGEIVQALPTGQEVSHMVAATPDMSRAFVPSLRTGYVTVFDLQSGELIAQVYSGEGAEGIDASPDGREVWVTNRGENTITIFDTQSLEVIAKIPCEDFPIRAKFSPDGRLFLVSNARSGDVAIFDARGRTLIASVVLTPPVPEGQDQERYFSEFEGTSVPIGLVIPDNTHAWVANTRSDAITEINLESFEITRHVKAGKEPDGIGFSLVKPAF